MILRRSLLASLLAAPLFAAVKPTRAAEPIRLRVSGSPPTYQPMLTAVKQRFEAQNPDVAIAFDAFAQTFEELTQQTLRSAVVGDLPDITLNGSNQVRIQVDRGFVVPLDDRIVAEPAGRGIGRNALEMGKVRDRTFAIPIGYAVPVLFFNGDLVRRAGGNPDELPTTWDGVVDLAGRIHALDPKTIGGFIEADSYGNWTYLALVEGRGGRMMSPDDRTIMFDGPEGRWALEMFRRFGGTGQAQADMAQGMARAAFVAGGIGILASSSTILPTFERQIGDRFPLRMQHFPVTANVGHLPGGGLVGMILAQDRAKQDAAWRFLKFLTSADAQSAIVQFSGWISVNDAATHDPATELSRYQDGHPLYAALARTLPPMSGWYAFPGENTNKITTVIMDNLKSVVRLSLTPDEAMPRIVAEVKALLPR